MGFFTAKVTQEGNKPHSRPIQLMLLGIWRVSFSVNSPVYNSYNSNHFVLKTDGEIFQLGTEYSLPQASGLSWAEK